MIHHHRNFCIIGIIFIICGLVYVKNFKNRSATAAPSPIEIKIESVDDVHAELERLYTVAEDGRKHANRDVAHEAQAMFIDAQVNILREIHFLLLNRELNKELR